MMDAFDATQPLPPGVTLLEASAGTGKTYTIASLALRLVVEHGVPIDELLVVTFTETATAELRDRVRARLRNAHELFSAALRGTEETTDDAVTAWLLERAKADGTLVDGEGRLRHALESFDTAGISTIHGFCQRLLREHAFECGAEFEAELLEDGSDVLAEVVHDFWAREVASRSPALVSTLLGDAKSRISFDNLLDLAVRTTADPELRLVPAQVAAPSPVLAYDERCRNTAAIWRAQAVAIQRLIDEAVDGKILSGGKWSKQYRPSWFAAVDGWAAAPERTAPPDHLWRFTRERVRASANKGKEAQAPSHEFFAACEALKAALAHEELALKHGLAAYARAEFAARKRARRQQTFDDLLVLVRDALRDSTQGERVAAAVRSRFQAALIDEFQDTDAVQWEIFRTIFKTGSHRLVLIGDPKQSIYGFRRADVQVYIAARQAADEDYGLDVNYRSDAGLVDAVNHVFSRVKLPFGVNDIGYDAVGARYKESRLVGAREPAGAPFRLRFLPRTGRLQAKDAAEPTAKETLWRELPRHVAADIASTLDEGLCIRREGTDGGLTEHAVRPGDIAVLVRKNKNARDVQAALRERGIPSVLRAAGSVWDSEEALEMEWALAAMLEPSKMRRARAALATDFLGVPAAAELVEEGRCEEPAGAGDALAAMDADEALWDRWVERLRAWGDRWARRGFMAMFQELGAALKLPERLLALEDGERRLTNLRHLAELLHGEAISGSLEPLALLEWLHEQRQRPDGDADSRKLRLESDADAVQIVTVHSSKGLEYPIVFCPYLLDGALANNGDKVHVRFREREADGREVRKLDIAQNDARDVHVAQLDVSCFEENLRLAYVALTRARHRCTVYWGNVKEGGSSPLGYLLHYPANETEPPSDFKHERERVAALTDEQVRVELGAIAASSKGTIAVSDVADAPVTRWRDSAGQTDARTLAARTYGRVAPLDSHWRIGSFSGLTRDVHAAHEAAQFEAADDASADAHESLADARATDGPLAASESPRIMLHEFPSSARAGLFFHEVLESADFTAVDNLLPLVDTKLRAFGFDVERWRRLVAEALAATIQAPLGKDGTSLRLAGVAPNDRLSELRFEFPVRGGLDAPDTAVSGRDLARVFRDHPGGALPAAYADRLAALAFRPLRGFMQGAIDLVARQHGRWHLVDYKSNRLGSTLLDYVPERLSAAMMEAHYFLQYHIYTVALHRYLRWRVPGYDYDRDFGGVYYLFFRGIAGAADAGTGVFFDRPPCGRIEALDRLMSDMEASA